MKKLSNVISSSPGSAVTSVLLLVAWAAWSLYFNSWLVVPAAAVLLATVLLVVYVC
ncbi:hypothetical protein LCGC14_1180210, partial [marine sediment metagenome]